MPQQKNNASHSSASKSSKSGTSSKGKKAAAKVPQKQPKRREIGALLCLLLGIFSALGYFGSEGIFIKFLCVFMRGLIGFGYYFLPPAFVIAAVILAFHRGRPVAFRVASVMCLPVLAGCLHHLFFCKTDYELAAFGLLWRDGASFASGGVLSGSVTVLFTYLFSPAGAGILFVALSVFCVLSSMNLTVASLIRKYKSRPRLEYEPEPEPEPRPIKKRKTMREEAEQSVDLAQPEKAFIRTERAAKRAIDVPINDPLVVDKKKSSLFNKNPQVATPDEFITGKPREMPENAEAFSQEDMVDEPAAYDRLDKLRPLTPADTGGEAEVQEVQMEKGQLRPTAEPEAPSVPPISHVARPAEPSVHGQGVQTPPKKAAESSGIEVDVFDASAVKMAPDGAVGQYVFPSLALLSAGTPGGRNDATEEIHFNRERLEATLKSFGINSKISNVTRGPTVTRYETELEAGVKLNKLTNLSDDIALSLGASGVRIAAIPNKISTVGIEVPNKNISTVYLREIIDSVPFKSSSSKLTFAIGKNISGEAIVGNISKLPHMLVAGTTGSGKSVCLNSLILSILYKATPDEVKFIMVDPKMVEFKIYNGIPHLLVPVVTEAKKAAGALQWAVTEMMKRYRLFSESGARDIASYNELVRRGEDSEAFPLPSIIVIIDELADLMMVAAKEVEEAICRIAQMGRAAGVHLVIATQSPRADVITGLMKANIPSRIALKVSSSLESRIILDAGGSADKLVGNGDMLYAPTGTSKPLRVQGTWVSDEERESIVEFIKRSGNAEYSEEIISQIEKAAEEKGGPGKAETKPELADDLDELYPQAVEVILDSGQASVSMLQRRLKLGYSRAARLVDQMEEHGIVGPFEGSKPRQLLITKQQWQEMQFIDNTAPIGKPQAEAEQTMQSAEDLFEP